MSRYTAFVHRCLLSGSRSAPECELDKPVYTLLVLTRSSVNAVYLQGLALDTIRFCIFYVSAHAQYECSDRVCCRRAGIHVSTSLVSGTVRTGAIQNHRHCRERALLGIVPAMATAVLYFFAFACSLQLGKVSGV